MNLCLMVKNITEEQSVQIRNFVEGLQPQKEERILVFPFLSAEDAFTHELAAEYYDPVEQEQQYEDLANTFANTDGLLDDSVVMQVVDEFMKTDL